MLGAKQIDFYKFQSIPSFLIYCVFHSQSARRVRVRLHRLLALAGIFCASAGFANWRYVLERGKRQDVSGVPGGKVTVTCEPSLSFSFFLAL